MTEPSSSDRADAFWTFVPIPVVLLGAVIAVLDRPSGLAVAALVAVTASGVAVELLI